jgi:hypothetical protein
MVGIARAKKLEAAQTKNKPTTVPAAHKQRWNPLKGNDGGMHPKIDTDRCWNGFALYLVNVREG